MMPERRKDLMRDIDLELTVDEVAQGYCFCAEWDGLLVNVNNDPEAIDCCSVKCAAKSIADGEGVR